MRTNCIGRYVAGEELRTAAQQRPRRAHGRQQRGPDHGGPARQPWPPPDPARRRRPPPRGRRVASRLPGRDAPALPDRRRRPRRSHRGVRGARRAVGVLDTLLRVGVGAPGEVSVIGCDNSRRAASPTSTSPPSPRTRNRWPGSPARRSSSGRKASLACCRATSPRLPLGSARLIGRRRSCRGPAHIPGRGCRPSRQPRPGSSDPNATNDVCGAGTLPCRKRS